MQRYFAVGKEENEFILQESDLFHIKKVMRSKEDSLHEIVFENKLYHAKLKQDKLILEKEISEKKEREKKINLIIPLLKEQKLDYIFQKATELGASKITLVDMERSIVKIEGKVEKKLVRWQSIIKEAAEQSKRIDMPEIVYEKRIKNIEGTKLICIPNASISIKNYLKTNTIYDTLNIVIGPEGGISKKEEEFYNKEGFTSVSLGDEIMRAETVPLFVLSIINYEYME